MYSFLNDIADDFRSIGSGIGYPSSLEQSDSSDLMASRFTWIHHAII